MSIVFRHMINNVWYEAGAYDFQEEFEEALRRGKKRQRFEITCRDQKLLIWRDGSKRYIETNGQTKMYKKWRQVKCILQEQFKLPRRSRRWTQLRMSHDQNRTKRLLDRARP